MKYSFTSKKVAFTCLALAFMTVDIAVAEDPASTEERDDAENLQLITDGTLPESDDGEIAEDDPALDTKAARQVSDEDNLRLTFESYKSAIEIGSYDEANDLAKRMVELTIQLYGLDSHESARAISNLGLAQQKNKDYESAVSNYAAAIGIVERIEDRLSRELIRPLQGLGAAELSRGRPALAKAAYDRAIHVSHVNDGPLNLEQIGALEDLAEIHLTTGNIKKAADLHEFIFNLEAHNKDLNGEDILPAFERKAQWSHRMRYFEDERMLLRKIIRIIEKKRGKDDLSLIPPLSKLGSSYLYLSDFQETNNGQGGTTTSGDTYLRRAMRIADRNTDATWRIKVQTKLALADYYTLSIRATKAARLYNEAWDFLSDDEERLETRASFFDQPKILQNIAPAKYLNPPNEADVEKPTDDFETGTIVVSYDISDRGFPRKVRVVDTDPQGIDKMGLSVARETSRLIFRPRLVDGIPVATDDQSYVHEFFYRPSDLPPPEHEKANLDQDSEAPPLEHDEPDIDQGSDLTQTPDQEGKPQPNEAVISEAT